MGFTLIELSIVLVIIGLIVGGVLVGQDLIAAAEVRAQISQIEKYNTAVNTFHNKYSGIPGDLAVASASAFGFSVGTNCVGTAGMRDGNGIIDGYSAGGLLQGVGETGLFWEDLSSANLIDIIIPNSGGASFSCSAGGAVVASGTGLSAYFPTAKIGRGNYLYVYEVGGTNYYGLSAVSSNNSSGGMTSGVSIPAVTAYNIDKKIDDGIPLTGHVTVNYLTAYAVHLAPSASPAVAASCYDSTTTNGAYAIAVNNGAGLNCALSFQFQ